MKTTTLIAAVLAALTLATQAADVIKPQIGEPTTHGKITKSNLPPLPADWKDPYQQEPIVPLSERYLVKPVLDVPLRAPSICKGPDGTYYMTGTGARQQPDGTLDFENCTAIRLWKSTDLKTWAEVGEVFDPMKVGGTYDPAKPHLQWATQWTKTPRGLPGVADSLRHYLGVTSPEIHYLKDTFWITFSTNGEGTGLIKSTTGKAEGPYEIMGKKGSTLYTITSCGADPSLFQDDDGSVYWLWSPAWIAKMNDDMTGLAEAPRMLTCAPREELKGDVLVGRRGPFLWKAKGIYHLAVSDTMNRLGIHVEDTMVATSKELFGVYSKRIVMIPHGGQTTVFQDASGNYQATFCGNDRYAAFRDKAGIVPLEWMKSFRYQFSLPGGVLRTHPNKVYTERGPWHKLLPLFDTKDWYIRDHHVMQAPDGYFYVSGTVHGERYAGKLPIYRSRDLKNWEEIIVRTFDDEEELTPEAKQYRGKDGTDKISRGDWSKYYMSTAVNWVPKLKTFAINYEVWTKPKGTHGILLSTTGRGEGPYKRVAPGFNCAKFLEDDDGQFYMAWGAGGLKQLNDDFSTKKNLPFAYPAAGGYTYEDSNGAMVKMHGKYVFMGITYATGHLRWLPTSAFDYGYAYMTSDSPTGPWSKWMPGLNHCAWGPPFRGLDGHWYASTFGEDMLGSFWLKASIVRLKTELKDGQLLIDIDENWTPADYVPVTEWKGEGTFSPYTDTAKGPKKK